MSFIIAKIVFAVGVLPRSDLFGEYIVPPVLLITGFQLERTEREGMEVRYERGKRGTKLGKEPAGGKAGMGSDSCTRSRVVNLLLNDNDDDCEQQCCRPGNSICFESFIC